MKFIIYLAIFIFLAASFLASNALFFSKAKSLHILGEDIPTIRAIKEHSTPSTQFDLMAYEEMSDQANFNLATGSDVYDIILQYNTALANYIGNHYVVSFDELREKFPDRLVKGVFPFENDLFQKSWKEVGWYKNPFDPGSKEKAYAIPFSANTMIMACNHELFQNEAYRKEYKEKYKKELTFPQTWEEFKQIANFFHRPNEGIYGICLTGAPFFIYYEWANFAYSLGDGIMKKTYGWEGNAKTPILLATPPTIKATRSYMELKLVDASDDYFKTDAVTQVEILKRKKVALALVWSDVVYSLAYKDGAILGLYDFHPIPGKVSMLAGGSFYINRRGKHTENAMEFVLDIMDEEKQIALMQSGLCSPLQSIYETREVQSIPYAKALKTSLNRGVYMLEAGPDSAVITDIMSNALQNLMKTPTNKERAIDILQKAKEEIEERREKIFSQGIS